MLFKLGFTQVQPVTGRVAEAERQLLQLALLTIEGFAAVTTLKLQVAQKILQRLQP